MKKARPPKLIFDSELLIADANGDVSKIQPLLRNNPNRYMKAVFQDESAEKACRDWLQQEHERLYRPFRTKLRNLLARLYRA